MDTVLTPWPQIVVLPKVFPGGRLGQYRERAQPRRIELSSALGMADAKTKQYVVYHEIGHYFRVEHIPGTLSRAKEERFAHEFASYLLQPAALKATDPAAHGKISVLLSGKAKQQIKAFARTVLAKLGRSQAFA
jgi:hypothetical protein